MSENNIYNLGFDASLNKPIQDNSTGVVYDTTANAMNVGQILSGGQLTLKSLSIGGLVRQVAPGDDIQQAIDSVNREGGGTIQLVTGTYVFYDNIFLRSNVALIGSGADKTIIDFGGRGISININGMNGKSGSGNISGTEGNATITGTSTAFTTEAKASGYIWIQGVWYQILSITNDTTLIITETYKSTTGFTGFGNFYFLADDIIKNVKIEGITIIDSAEPGLTSVYGDSIFIDTVFVKRCLSNNISFQQVSNLLIFNSKSFSADSHGFITNNCTNMSLINCFSYGNVGTGFYITANSGLYTVSSNIIGCVSEGNDDNGFAVATANAVKIIGCTSRFNDGDGIDIGSSDTVQRTTVSSCSFERNDGFGIRVASAYNIIQGNKIFKNTNGPIVDDGTGNTISGNSEVSPNDEKQIAFMVNASGAGVREGNVVVFSSNALGNRVTTTSTNGDNKVFGMAHETTSNGSVGAVMQTGNGSLYVTNGASSISVGDFLSSYSHAYYAKKAATGDTVFAIALEGPTTSTAVISALLVSPRLI
ncbi:MAG: NosD domain-containing protein [Minisyncoccia bacterium]